MKIGQLCIQNREWSQKFLLLDGLRGIADLGEGESSMICESLKEKNE